MVTCLTKEKRVPIGPIWTPTPCLCCRPCQHLHRIQGTTRPLPPRCTLSRAASFSLQQMLQPGYEDSSSGDNGLQQITLGSRMDTMQTVKMEPLSSKPECVTELHVSTPTLMPLDENLVSLAGQWWLTQKQSDKGRKSERDFIKTKDICVLS